MSRMRIQRNSKGFTLVELMITVVISSCVGGAIFAAFNAMHQSYLKEDATAYMQSNVRAAMEMLERDIRLAGYDWNGTINPSPTLFPDATVVVPGSPSWIHMTMDLNANRSVADADEDIAYGFAPADDANGDGIADAGAAPLGRRDGSVAVPAYDPMATDIQAIAFAYAYDATGDRIPETYTVGGTQQTIWAANLAGDGKWYNLDTNGDGFIDATDGPGAGGNGFIAGTGSGIAINSLNIRAVRVWILARAAQPDLNYSDSNTYVIGNKVISPNDHYRRRLLETTVVCKNR